MLTGITTSGTPHLGNYVGAIRPAIAASLRPGVETFYFLADYHALIQSPEPAAVRRSTLEIAATWLAAGLADGALLYRQSDLPEVLELAWFLACTVGKGLLNRAHAYKAALDRNAAAGADPDAGVALGLFLYPVLMAADILLFKAESVPVGRDQLQHIEMARDMAARFNHRYGERLVLPGAAIDESLPTLPGLDGRKMSKSYRNGIALMASAPELRKRIFAIVTDSRAPGEPKEAEASTVFRLYQAFATPEESARLRSAFAAGIAWGDAKQALYEKVEATVAPMRSRYESLVAHPRFLEQRLQDGAARARAIARPFLAELRHAVGLRPLF